MSPSQMGLVASCSVHASLTIQAGGSADVQPLCRLWSSLRFETTMLRTALFAGKCLLDLLVLRKELVPQCQLCLLRFIGSNLFTFKCHSSALVAVPVSVWWHF